MKGRGHSLRSLRSMRLVSVWRQHPAQWQRYSAAHPKPLEDSSHTATIAPLALKHTRILACRAGLRSSQSTEPTLRHPSRGKPAPPAVPGRLPRSRVSTGLEWAGVLFPWASSAERGMADGRRFLEAALCPAGLGGVLLIPSAGGSVKAQKEYAVVGQRRLWRLHWRVPAWRAMRASASGRKFLPTWGVQAVPRHDGSRHASGWPAGRGHRGAQRRRGGRRTADSAPTGAHRLTVSSAHLP
jgi:hypothetical protein